MQEIESGSNPILPAASSEWLAKVQEDIVEPDLPIIDAHHHIWKLPRVPRFRAEELLEEADSGHNIIGSVFAECTEGYLTDGPEHLRPVGETIIAVAVGRACDANCDDTRNFCAGIVSYADLRAGQDVGELLDAHIEAGEGRFRGIRQSSVWEATGEIRTTMRTPPEGLLLDASFRVGFAELVSRGLTFDGFLYHTQIPEIVDLARAFPEAKIVLDHVGSPIGIGPYSDRDAVFKIWRANMEQLRSVPNLFVKVGGMGMKHLGFAFHEKLTPPTSDELVAQWQRYFDVCMEVAGPDRCMMESNFPVDRLSCSYQVVWNALKKLATGCSADEKAKLFRDTAAGFYTLDV